MANRNLSDQQRRCYLIDDEDDSPQRYPLRRLLEAVAAEVVPTPRSWLVGRVWGQGFKTARLEDSVGPTPDEVVELETSALLDLDDDPDEWFYDVDVYTTDRSFKFGIFDSGRMFIEGPQKQVEAIVRQFHHVTAVDPDTWERLSAD